MTTDERLTLAMFAMRTHYQQGRTTEARTRLRDVMSECDKCLEFDEWGPWIMNFDKMIGGSR